MVVCISLLFCKLCCVAHLVSSGAGVIPAISAVLPPLVACCEQEIQQMLNAQQQQQQQQQQGASNALVLIHSLLLLWTLYTAAGATKEPQLLRVGTVAIDLLFIGLSMRLYHM
jgi:hypothetical protein